MNRLLRVERTGIGVWVQVRVCQAIINGAQARGPAVGKVSYLHGSRLPRKCQQPVTAHVHGQIDQNVDLILANLVGQFLV